MQQSEHADGQREDNRQRRQGEHAQHDVHLALIGLQGVQDVELVGSCARQLHLRAHEDPGRFPVGVGRPDSNGLPLSAAPGHGLAHLGGDEAAHLLVLDLVDAQRGSRPLRAKERNVGSTGASRGCLERGQGTARGLLDLVGGRGRRGGEHRLRGGKTQRCVSQDRVAASFKHGRAQLRGDDDAEDKKNTQRGGGDGQGELGRQGVADAVDQLRGAQRSPRPRGGDGANEAPRAVTTHPRRHGTQPRGR